MVVTPFDQEVERRERNARVQARYDELMAEAKHGHYETMFRVVREEIDRLATAALPFAAHDWMDASLEDDNCQLVRHSGNITVGQWRALRAELGWK